MRHGNQNRKFGRSKDQRTALMRGLAVALINEGKIKTTAAKAKELSSFAERLVTCGKEDTVAARRRAQALLGMPEDSVIKKLFSEIAPNYKDRNGGYTRVIKMGRQLSGKDEAVIEYV
jgi:large subunit ribosomal protein L17